MAQNSIKVKGKVVVAHSTTEYDVLLENNITIKASVSGKMRIHNIRILPGDVVDIELSSYDLTRGRIIYRYK